MSYFFLFGVHAQSAESQQPAPNFMVGVNYPWIVYGHDFDNNWGHDGFSASGWTVNALPGVVTEDWLAVVQRRWI